MRKPLSRARGFVVIAAALAAVAGTALSGEGVSIQADRVVFDKERGIFDAKGSVEVQYKGITIEARELKYSKTDNTVDASGGFILRKNNFDITGQSLDYDLKNDTGSADSVKIMLGSTWVEGKGISFDPEKIDFNDSSFSSCDLDHPHYKITSRNMTFYQETGWIVQYLGLFYINGVPVVPVPTYVFDTGFVGGRYKKKNPAPLPEIGSNDEDGLYFRQKVIWRLSSYSYGLLSLDYMTRKGPGLGFETNFLPNKDNEGSFRVYTSGGDGWSGGVTDTLYFGDDIRTDEKRYLFYEMLDVPPRKKYSASIDASYRERENYERVSKLPMVTLKYTDVPYFLPNFNQQVDVFAGSVSEESSGVRAAAFGAKSDSQYFQDLGRGMVLRERVGMNYTSYSQYGRWFSVIGGIDLEKTFSENLLGSVGYAHYFFNEGASPFRYENYRYFPYDELRGGLQLKYGIYSLGIMLSYNTPLFTVRDIDYNATVQMHCFDLMLSYRAARNEFAFGINFVSR